jgi:hypothetical protein
MGLRDLDETAPPSRSATEDETMSANQCKQQ